MQRKYIGVWLGTLCLSATPMLMGATTKSSSSTSGVDQSSKPAQLLTEIRADAVQIRSAAAHLDNLAQKANTQWMDYDQQWNEIKPSVEDMQMKLERLEGMQSSLTPAQRTEMDQTKPLVGEIQSRTHQFLTLLDKPGVQTTDVKFKTYARSLRSEADKLEKAAPAS